MPRNENAEIEVATLITENDLASFREDYSSHIESEAKLCGSDKDSIRGCSAWGRLAVDFVPAILTHIKNRDYTGFYAMAATISEYGFIAYRGTNGRTEEYGKRRVQIAKKVLYANDDLAAKLEQVIAEHEASKGK